MKRTLAFLKPNPDILIGFIVLWAVIAYVIAYGVVRLGGFVFDGTVFGYLAILLPIWLVDGLKSSFESLVPKQYKYAEEDLSKVTVIIACKDGEKVIAPTLKSVLRKFALSNVIVVSNGSTDRTCEIARTAGVQCLEYKEPLGKVRAINAALPHVHTPYVLLLDDDTLLAGATIPTGLLDQGYDAVAFRVMVRLETWVSQLQSHEYRKSFDIGRRYHNHRASVQNISGAIGLFKCESLEWQVSRHTGEFSGEDLQRTLLIHLAAHRQSPKGVGGVVLSRSIVITQAPTELGELFRQRVFGWFPGLYANFGNYIKILFRRRTPVRLRLDAFYNCFLVIGLDILRLLALPIMIFYPWYFAITYFTYVMLELVPYMRTYRTEPLWVIMIYPFYGIFGLLTRICAGGVFFYRRLVRLLSRQAFRDDYRRAPGVLKYVGVGTVVLGLSTILVLNIIYGYALVVLSFSWLQ